MNPDTKNALLQARGPDELKRAIVAALEEIEAAAPPDPWAGDWAEPSQLLDPAAARELLNAHMEQHQRSQEQTNKAAAIAHVQALVDATTNPEDRTALEAQLRLLKDDGQVLQREREEGTRARITQAGKSGQVELPPPSPEKFQRRYNWAIKNKLNEFLEGSPLRRDLEGAAEAYARGGPLWLWLGNRQAIMAMPNPWRAEMVRDVQEDSPAEAHELARDVLKKFDELDLNSSSAQRALTKADQAWD